MGTLTVIILTALFTSFVWVFVLKVYIKASTNVMIRRELMHQEVRNKQIIDECEQVIAFQFNNSKGTEHAMNIAKEQGKKIFLYQS